MDNSLLSNIQKLFSERVDVFGPVEFSRTSVLTGVIKISLKTLLECVRMKTFGKFGLQQLQVTELLITWLRLDDTHFSPQHFSCATNKVYKIEETNEC